MDEMYTKKYLPGKRLGVVAIIPIKAGVRILADELLFSIKDNTEDEGIEGRISASLKQISSWKRQQFQKLFCPESSRGTPLVRRYLAHAYDLEYKESGIFLEASCFNHSCRANAFFTWNKSIGKLTVHAIKDISEDSEITVSYVFPFYSLAQRHKRLKDRYGFACYCQLCFDEIMSGQHDDPRRERMESLYITIDSFTNTPPQYNDKQLEMVHEYIILAENGVIGEHYYAVMYQRLYDYYEARGVTELALKYAQLEYEQKLRFLGGDYEITMSTAKRMDYSSFEHEVHSMATA